VSGSILSKIDVKNRFFYSLNAWLKDLCKDFIITRMDVRTLHFRIHTSNAKYLELRPEPPMRAALLSIVEGNHG